MSISMCVCCLNIYLILPFLACLLCIGMCSCWLQGPKSKYIEFHSVERSYQLSSHHNIFAASPLLYSLPLNASAMFWCLKVLFISTISLNSCCNLIVLQIDLFIRKFAVALGWLFYYWVAMCKRQVISHNGLVSVRNAFLVFWLLIPSLYVKINVINTLQCTLDKNESVLGIEPQGLWSIYILATPVSVHFWLLALQ